MEKHQLLNKDKDNDIDSNTKVALITGITGQVNKNHISLR